MLTEKESFRAEDTYALGKKIGEEARPGEVYTLIGDLGVGKTGAGSRAWHYGTGEQSDLYHFAEL